MLITRKVNNFLCIKALIFVENLVKTVIKTLCQLFCCSLNKIYKTLILNFKINCQ